MSESDPRPPIPLGGLTQIWDDQVSIFDELLGDPAELLAAPAGGGALVEVKGDPRTTIHPHTGAQQIGVGWTPAQVRDSLGEPESIIDFELDLGLEDFGVQWLFYALGLEVEFKQERVARITFHSGRRSGGLVPATYAPYEGIATPDWSLVELREAEVLARLGEPSSIVIDDPELAAILEERPARKLIYPGWTFTVYEDGTLESVSVPVHYVQP